MGNLQWKKEIVNIAGRSRFLKLNQLTHKGDYPVGTENVTNNTEWFVNKVTVKAAVLEEWNACFCI